MQTNGPRIARPKIIPDPTKIRQITGSFGWVDRRLLSNGYLEQIGPPQMALYLFLVLAADRHGVSYYRLERICKTVAMSEDEFHAARNRLLALKLIAFCPFTPGDVNGYYQVLPLG